MYQFIEIHCVYYEDGIMKSTESLKNRGQEDQKKRKQ
jgi:hypothetical protein